METNLTEMNRLYGVYHEVVTRKNAQKARTAWMEYYLYARRYHEERGIPISDTSVQVSRTKPR